MKQGFSVWPRVPGFRRFELGIVPRRGLWSVPRARDESLPRPPPFLYLTGSLSRRSASKNRRCCRDSVEEIGESAGVPESRRERSDIGIASIWSRVPGARRIRDNRLDGLELSRHTSAVANPAWCVPDRGNHAIILREAIASCFGDRYERAPGRIIEVASSISRQGPGLGRTSANTWDELNTGGNSTGSKHYPEGIIPRITRRKPADASAALDCGL